jgi:hypothetical protein
VKSEVEKKTGFRRDHERGKTHRYFILTCKSKYSFIRHPRWISESRIKEDIIEKKQNTIKQYMSSELNKIIQYRIIAIMKFMDTEYQNARSKAMSNQISKVHFVSCIMSNSIQPSQNLIQMPDFAENHCNFERLLQSSSDKIQIWSLHRASSKYIFYTIMNGSSYNARNKSFFIN